MKKNKGFTLIELVIVLAVIAILMAILIPTFSGIIKKANATKVELEIKNAVTSYIIDKSIEEFGNVDIKYIIASYKDGDKERFFYQNDEGEFAELDCLPSALEYVQAARSKENKKIQIYDFSRTHVCLRAYLLYELAEGSSAHDLFVTRFDINGQIYKHTSGGNFEAIPEGDELDTILLYRKNYENDYESEENGVTLFFLE